MPNKTTNKAQIGDVIMSPDFTKSQTDSQGNISVGHSYGIDKPAPQRAKAKYVVEDAKMDGGGGRNGRGPGDIYPDGWEVTARKLRPDGTYNPKGEVIRFYQSGSFTCMIETVQLVGKLKKVVDFI